MNAMIQPAAMNDGVLGVARGEEHLDSRMAPLRLLGELAARHATRHDDVGKQELRAGHPRQCRKCRLALCSLQNSVTKAADPFGDEEAHLLVILDRKTGWKGKRGS